MNILTLDIEQSEKENEHWLKVLIDGVDFRQIIQDNLSAAFFDELKASFEKPGHYLIFTCNCGVADCAGWNKVIVEHSADEISWNIDYNGNYNFKFQKENYKAEIGNVRWLMAVKKIKLQPEFIVDPE